MRRRNASIGLFQRVSRGKQSDLIARLFTVQQTAEVIEFLVAVRSPNSHGLSDRGRFQPGA